MGRTDETNLAEKLEEARARVAIGLRYAHYSDPAKLYEVIDIALREADEAPVVIYRALYGAGLTWVRSVDEWCGTVVVDGQAVPRFRPVG